MFASERSTLYIPCMSTLQEIQAAASALPAEDRSTLVTWLSTSPDVWECRRGQLRADIDAGLRDIASGNVAPLDMEDIKRKARLRYSMHS